MFLSSENFISSDCRDQKFKKSSAFKKFCAAHLYHINISFIIARWTTYKQKILNKVYQKFVEITKGSIIFTLQVIIIALKNKAPLQICRSEK